MSRVNKVADNNAVEDLPVPSYSLQQNHEIFSIRGIPVLFPGTPYSVQMTYMEKVIEALQTNNNAVLESPTGTGKTLSLLCSCLAWQKSMRAQIVLSNANAAYNDPILGTGESSTSCWGASSAPDMNPIRHKIIYSSRTHAQLSKAMQELRSSPYGQVKVTVLGSRDQMCIHPIVSKENTLTAKNALCAMHVKAKSCYYNNQVENAKKDPNIPCSITDIEDLVKYGRNRSCCPFYLARDLQEHADIIFMPYNYLFDPQIRKKLNIQLNESVVILDEGHNVDRVCEEAASVSLTSADIAVAIEDVTTEMSGNYADQGEVLIEKKYSNDDLCSVKERLLELEDTFDNDVKADTNSATYPGSHIYTLLSKAHIDREYSGEMVRVLKSLQEVLQYKTTGTTRRGFAVGKIADVLDVLFSIQLGDVDKYFKTHVILEVTPEHDRSNWGAATKSTVQSKRVDFWCFHPGFGMKGLLNCGVHSLILTSGTLAPLSATVQELALVRPIILESPHVIKNDQVKVCIVSAGPNNVVLNSSYSNRNNDDYWTAIGLTLQNFMRVVPDGILVFFPSYTNLKKAVDSWKESGLWNRLFVIKPLFIEGTAKGSFTTLIESYRESIALNKGGVLLGVCRGKVAEGMDFIDSYGRAVLVFGLPYPPLFDPRVKLKKQYLNTNKEIKDLSGDLWYQLEATRAVNQAIGRVIRHVGDYGAIILCDAKFKQQNVINNLSKWIQPLVTEKSFGETIYILKQFFYRNMTQFQSQTKPENLPIPSANSASSSNASSYGASTNISAFISSTFTSNASASSVGVNSRPIAIKALGQCQPRPKSCMQALKLSEENMEKPKQLPYPSSVYSLGNFDKNITQPAKRRKIVVAPILIRDAKPFDPLDNNMKSQVEQLNSAKNFILEMKNTLEDISYAKFHSVFAEYQDSNDVDDLIKKLSILFPAEDPYFRDIFIDCRKLLSGKDLETYNKFCETNYPL